MKLELEPIGIVHSPYKNRYEVPRQEGEEVSEIIVFDEYEEGLKDIEGFSHLYILYYLHKSKGYSLSCMHILWMIGIWNGYIDRFEMLKQAVPVIAGAIVFILIGLYMMKSGVKKTLD